MGRQPALADMLRAGPEFTFQPAVLCGREGTGRGRLEEEGHPRKPGPSLHCQVHRQLPGPHINSTLDVRLDEQQAEAGANLASRGPHRKRWNLPLGEGPASAIVQVLLPGQA